MGKRPWSNVSMRKKIYLFDDLVLAIPRGLLFIVVACFSLAGCENETIESELDESSVREKFPESEHFVSCINFRGTDLLTQPRISSGSENWQADSLTYLNKKFFFKSSENWLVIPSPAEHVVFQIKRQGEGGFTSNLVCWFGLTAGFSIDKAVNAEIESWFKMFSDVIDIEIQTMELNGKPLKYVSAVLMSNKGKINTEYFVVDAECGMFHSQIFWKDGCEDDLFALYDVLKSLKVSYSHHEAR